MILVPVVVVTPAVVDQKRLYEVAPATAGQEMVTWLSPAVATTPVGALGTVVGGGGALVPPPQPARIMMILAKKIQARIVTVLFIGHSFHPL
jgi:hypothetical protein